MTSCKQTRKRTRKWVQPHKILYTVHGFCDKYLNALSLFISVPCTLSTAFISGEYGAVYSWNIPISLLVSENSPLNCWLLSVATACGIPNVPTQCSLNSFIMLSRLQFRMDAVLRYRLPSSIIVSIYLASLP
eukprot:NODE_139_length_17940_cov_0.254190.p9 type:complete len:132 gc:universal NODE_139_length_17940_cov_0.254190:1361-966(-)